MKRSFPLLAALLASCTPPQPEIRWKLVFSEDFESLRLAPAAFKPNTLVETDRHADDGAYFQERAAQAGKPFEAPFSYRSSTRIGAEGWLQLEGYTQDPKRRAAELFSLQPRPSHPGDHVLRLSSLRHNDGAVLRSAQPLPPQYRVCLQAGFARFGNGRLDVEHNGYLGNERAGPWLDMSSVFENGHYWLAILSAEPKPRNNVWIHHHRKVVLDSDNNVYPAEDGGAWTRIWNGKSFVQSGERPVMIFALDRDHGDYPKKYDRTGQPFLSWAADRWNPEALVHEIRAADAYLPERWYEVCIQKTVAEYRLSMDGEFKFGGRHKYEAALPRAKVFDPSGSPDYFMTGDPHVNFYRGSMLINDVRLYVPDGP